MGSYREAAIDKPWKIIDLGTLNIANARYLEAKSALKRARVHNTKTEYEVAEKKYEEFFKNFKLDTNAFVEMAEIQRYLQKYDEAIEQIKEAIELKNKRPKFLQTDQSSLYAKLFILYFLNDENEKADEALKKVKKPSERLKLRDNSEMALKIIDKSKFEKSKNFLKKIKDEIGSAKSDVKGSTSLIRPQDETKHSILILAYLKLFNLTTIGDLRRNLEISNSIVDRTINDLIEREFIEKIPTATKDMYQLTKDGKEAGEEIVTTLNQLINSVDPKSKERLELPLSEISVYSGSDGRTIQKYKKIKEMFDGKQNKS